MTGVLKPLAVLVGIAIAAPVHAAEDPDWPCVQRLVPELSPAMMWSGPALDEAMRAWRSEPAVAELAPELAARRVPLEEAEARVHEFAASLDDADRDEALTLLFAGVLQIIGAERREIISGIKRFSGAQQGLAERIRQANKELRNFDGGTSAAAEMRRQELRQRRDWEVRLFDERRSALTYLCEQPVLLEQRAFALARAIGGELT